MNDQNEPTQSGALPSVPLQPLVRQIDVQNALRLLCRVSRKDEEMVFVGNDMILFREHLYRTQEVAEMLMPNPAIRGRESSSVPCTGVVGHEIPIEEGLWRRCGRTEWCRVFMDTVSVDRLYYGHLCIEFKTLNVWRVKDLPGGLRGGWLRKPSPTADRRATEKEKTNE